MKLIFVRHGKDDDRFRGGWSHLDLIPEGIEQAKNLGVEIIEDEVTNIQIDIQENEQIFKVQTLNNEFKSKSFFF